MKPNVLTVTHSRRLLACAPGHGTEGDPGCEASCVLEKPHPKTANRSYLFRAIQLKFRTTSRRIVARVACCLTIAIAFAQSGMPFSAPNHTEITTAALSFMRPDVLSDLIDNNHWVDNLYLDVNYWHFDSCAFEEGTLNMENWYAAAINALNPDRLQLEEAVEAFGHVLHPAQDFYAHANWVELGERTLIDRASDTWNLLTPYSMVYGVFVVEGDGPGYGLHRDGRIVTVTTSLGDFPGLITGAYPFLSSCECPDSIAIHHDELNKDSDGRPFHPAARALATKQTRHEWCRLLSLLRTAYGERGVQVVVENWVENIAASEAICTDEDGTFSIFVDWASTEDEELGTSEKPFHTIAPAVGIVPLRSTIQIAAGYYSAPGTYANPMILKATGGIVSIGQ